MGKWILDISEVGRDLRKSINNSEQDVESCKVILENIQKCCNYIGKHYHAKTTTFQYSLDELNLLVEDYLKEYEGDCDFCYFYASDVVDECLEALYDFCDMYRIWISI